jgi:hypothetical protein
VLLSGGTPHLFTFASSAVRLCQAALAAGIDLDGAQLTVTGEPLTAARLAVIERSGAQAAGRYAITECGALGFGCQNPAVSDDVHLLSDLHALIQPEPNTVPVLSDKALFITALRPTTPFILLNVSMGDQAEMVDRSCGCPLEALGWRTHLQHIRSYEKLTAGGMTFLDTDVVRVLEDVLPARFGGGPTDYQLVEQETETGAPRLSLLVHPDLGPLDEAALAEEFLAAISVGPGPEPVMGQLWREAKMVRVERVAPRTTPTGKILHLHRDQQPSMALPESH